MPAPTVLVPAFRPGPALLRTLADLRAARPDWHLLVVDDGSGAAYADRFERLFATPHGVDLAALCAATRTPHWRVESRAELEHALASPAGGIEVVEARVDRRHRRALDEAIRALA